MRPDRGVSSILGGGAGEMGGWALRGHQGSLEKGPAELGLTETGR